MLELDVFLIPYVEAFGATWSVERLHGYMQLLDEADPDLFAWCMGYEEPPERYRDWIREIRRFRLRDEG
jgi:succinate dehydrogenase flavin-adding protein (antitoxin of CptAB toxin-antitoxin module)